MCRPMQGPQPGVPMVAPASSSASRLPSFIVSVSTSLEAGTTIMRTPAATCLTAQDLGGGVEVLQPAVGAGAEEDHVDRDAGSARRHRRRCPAGWGTEPLAAPEQSRFTSIHALIARARLDVQPLRHAETRRRPRRWAG